MIKSIPLTSNIPLNWDCLHHLDVFNLARAFDYKVLGTKRTLDSGQEAEILFGCHA